LALLPLSKGSPLELRVQLTGKKVKNLFQKKKNLLPQSFTAAA
jgi:hypothetical protein